jgi:hypothetical protein
VSTLEFSKIGALNNRNNQANKNEVPNLKPLLQSERLENTQIQKTKGLNLGREFRRVEVQNRRMMIQRAPYQF